MKSITLYALMALFSLSVYGQSAARLSKTFEENREKIEQLSGPVVARAAGIVFSPALQSQLRAGLVKSNDFTMKTDSVIDSYVDPGPEDWQKDYKDEFTYDAQWRASQIIEHEWDPQENEWELWGRTDLTYDDGHLVRMQMHSSEFNGELYPETRIDLFHGDDGSLDSLYIYDAANAEEWSLLVRQYYTYTPGGLLAQVDMMVYDEEEDEWYEGMTTVFEYDEADRRVLTSVYFSAEQFGEEILYSQTEFSYDADGRLSVSETSTLDFSTFALSPDYRLEYTYDDDGDQSMVVEYDWFDGVWVEDYMEEFFYDADISFRNVAFPYRIYAMFFIEFEEEFELDFGKTPIEVRGHAFIDGEFVVDYRTELFYSAIAPTDDEYTLTYLAGDNGSLTGETTQVVAQGEDGSPVTAVPEEGYVFSQWSDGRTDNPRTDINVSADITVTAHFAAQVVTITAAPNNPDYGSVSGDGEYEYGDEVTLTATPADGYHFIDWTEDGTQVSTHAEYVFVAEEDRELVANFAAQVFTITATAGDGGSITPSGEVAVQAGDDQEFTIEPGEGYQVDDVLVDGESVGAVTTYVFENVSGDHSIHAGFSPIGYAVTFQVDMRYVTDEYADVEFDPENDDVFITGDFFDWAEPGADPDRQLMSPTDDDPMVYSKTLVLEPGDYEYKYFLNAGWDGGEWVGDPNREVEVVEAKEVYDWFGSLTDPTDVSLAPGPTQIRAFPNPASSRVTIESGEPMSAIYLIDLLGQVVRSEPAGGTSHEIQVYDLRNGLYFIQVVTASGVQTLRIQVAH